MGEARATPTRLNYDYQEQTGDAPSGCAYRSPVHPSLLTVSCTDHDGNDNTAFLGTLAVGDPISVNGVNWTIQSIRPGFGSIEFTIATPRLAPPYGVTGIIFGGVYQPSASDQTLIDHINDAIDIYLDTHGFEGPNARSLLIRLILAEVNASQARGRNAYARSTHSSAGSDARRHARQW